MIARAAIAVHAHGNSREETGEEQRGFYLSRRRKQNKVARFDVRRAHESVLEGIRRSSRSSRRRREVAPQPAPSGGAAATRRRRIEPRCRIRRMPPGASGPSTQSSCSRACAVGPRATPGARRVRRRRCRSVLPSATSASRVASTSRPGLRLETRSGASQRAPAISARWEIDLSPGTPTLPRKRPRRKVTKRSPSAFRSKQRETILLDYRLLFHTKGSDE